MSILYERYSGESYNFRTLFGLMKRYEQNRLEALAGFNLLPLQILLYFLQEIHNSFRIEPPVCSNFLLLLIFHNLIQHRVRDIVLYPQLVPSAFE